MVTMPTVVNQLPRRADDARSKNTLRHLDMTSNVLLPIFNYDRVATVASWWIGPPVESPNQRMRGPPRRRRPEIRINSSVPVRRTREECEVIFRRPVVLSLVLTFCKRCSQWRQQTVRFLH